MNSFNLNFIAISFMAIFFGVGLSKNLSVVPYSSSKSNYYSALSDSSKSDSTKKDSTAGVPQLIEVGKSKKTNVEKKLKPQNIVDEFAADSIFLVTDKPVEYIEGEMPLFYKFVAYNIVYPKEARKQKQQEKIYVRFVVNKDGTVSRTESIRGKYDLLKKEAERVIGLTKWIPAQIKGENVRSLMTIPIIFKLDAATIAKKAIDSDKEISMANVSEVPTFNGGLEKFMSYISQNLVYPKMAKRIGEQGKVIVEFAVGTDGSLSDFKVIQSVGVNCDAEALRVLKNSPKWIPAKKDGQPVKTRISHSIVFKLDP